MQLRYAVSSTDSHSVCSYEIQACAATECRYFAVLTQIACAVRYTVPGTLCYEHTWRVQLQYALPGTNTQACAARKRGPSALCQVHTAHFQGNSPKGLPPAPKFRPQPQNAVPQPRNVWGLSLGGSWILGCRFGSGILGVICGGHGEIN